MHRQIVMVRHGEAYNTVAPDGRRQVVDPANPPLTPLGEQQAEATAVVVRAFDPDQVLSSPFVRAAQTAQRHLRDSSAGAALDVRLGEHFVFGSLEHFGGVPGEIYAVYGVDRFPVVDGLAGRDLFPHYPEPLTAVDLRVSALLDAWIGRADWRCVAIFTHGAVLGAIGRHLVPEVPLDPNPRHCSVSRFVERDSGWSIEERLDTSHLATITGFP